MGIVTIILIVVIGLALFFVWANRQTKKHHEDFQKSDVIAALENILSDDSVSHDEWDLFLNWRIKDSYLESVRQRCMEIVAQHSDDLGKDISGEGVKKIEVILKELQACT